MKTQIPSGNHQRFAFTLIELLVVIAIIGILAALTFPALKGIKNGAARRKAKAELRAVETAIESYKAHYGFYPPDNPNNFALNQLFYELRGTVNTNGTTFETLDHFAIIPAVSVPTVFGLGVSGFVNCTRAGSGDEVKPAKNFLPKLASGQYQVVTNSGIEFAVLTTTIKWPPNMGFSALGVPEVNPIQYNSSRPTNNSGSYDVWVDVYIAGRTNRISNWSDQPQLF